MIAHHYTTNTIPPSSSVFRDITDSVGVKSMTRADVVNVTLVLLEDTDPGRCTDNRFSLFLFRFFFVVVRFFV